MPVVVIDIFSKIIAIWSIILIIVGIALNPLVCYICLKSKQLRSKSTFKLLAIVSICDLISLFEWNLDHFTQGIFNHLESKNNVFYCRFVTMFLQYVTLEFSSWMWLSISLDRVMSLFIKEWTKNYFSGLFPLVYSTLLAMIIVAINFIDIFTLGYGFINANGTFIVVCGATSGYDFSLYNVMSKVYIHFFRL